MKALFLTFLFSIGLPYAGHAQEAALPKTLSINTEHFPPYSKSDGTGFENLLTDEVLGRLGVTVTYNFLPSERVLVNADSGLDDGILPRVGGMAAKYPNLVQVEESALSFDFVAFGRRADIEISGWKSLEPYDVAIITGWKILEQNVTNTKSLTKVKTAEQLFSLLDAGRVDLVIYARLAGMQMIKDRRLADIRAVEPPLATKELFYYLHKKHESLSGPFSEALRQAKADGTYQKIYDATIGPLLAGE